MATATGTEQVWTSVFAGLRADALDCLQVNLAVVADRLQQPGAHLVLGAPLRFASKVQAAGPPVVAATIDDRLAEASELAGLRVTGRWDDVDGAGLRDLAADHRLLYVVGDAYTMPWVPYAGQRHLEHSFLLKIDGLDALIIDAYHNNTEWGQARPGVWTIPATDLGDVMPGGGIAVVLTAGPPPEVDPHAVLAANAAAMTAAQPDIERYLAAHRAAGADQAVLDQAVLDV